MKTSRKNNSNHLAKEVAARRPLAGVTEREVSHRVSHRRNGESAANSSGSGEVSHCHTVTPGDYTPFPVGHLPRVLRDLVTAGAGGIGCDPAMIAIPGLAALAAAVGSTRVVEVKQGWTEPAVLWGAVIAESGSRKSPAFALATAPLADAQRKYHQDHAEEEAYRRDIASGDAKAGHGPPCRRVVMSDSTVDAVAPILRDNPRGVLLACDELDTWFQSFTRYSGGGGSDMPRWLALYHGHSLQVDRKTGGSIFVPRATASICGTIQPAIFNRAMNRSARDSGLAARLLLAMPPRASRRWTDATVPTDVVGAYGEAVRSLLDLTHRNCGGSESQPVAVPFSPEALSLFKAHVDHLGERADEAPDAEERAILSKLEGTPARLALVYELASATCPSEVKEIGTEAMAAAVALGVWFVDEVIRVFAQCGESDQQKECRELVAWIDRKGGEVSAREVQRHNQKRYPAAEHADATLAGMVAGGLGAWVGEGRGRRFRRTPSLSH